MRAHHVHVEHDFAKPPQRIFAYLAEHENLAEVFGAKIERLRDGQDGQRNGVGSARKLKIGPLAPFEETVTEFVPCERIVYRRWNALRLRHPHRLADPRARAARPRGAHALDHAVAGESRARGLIAP
jgi:uncharacterized protein YndB with AHSA1/START domain